MFKTIYWVLCIIMGCSVFGCIWITDKLYESNWFVVLFRLQPLTQIYMFIQRSPPSLTLGVGKKSQPQFPSAQDLALEWVQMILEKGPWTTERFKGLKRSNTPVGRTWICFAPTFKTTGFWTNSWVYLIWTNVSYMNYIRQGNPSVPIGDNELWKSWMPPICGSR